MLNAAHGMLAMLPVVFWVAKHAMVFAMTARSRGPIAESASSTVDPEAAVLCAANGKLATIIERLRAKWAQRRREQTEFKAWLEITSKPLW